MIHNIENRFVRFAVGTSLAIIGILLAGKVCCFIAGVPSPW